MHKKWRRRRTNERTAMCGQTKRSVVGEGDVGYFKTISPHLPEGNGKGTKLVIHDSGGDNCLRVC
jgi:hypothetical protein